MENGMIMKAYVDNDGSGHFSDGDDFIDSGNKMYDIEEEYTYKGHQRRWGTRQITLH